jgi:hypothetical protein
MKSVFFLSKDKPTISLISAAVSATGFQGKIQIARSDTLLLVRIADLEHEPPAAVFIDLMAVRHGVRLVEWLRLSSRTRRLRIVAIGEESEAVSIFRNAWGPHAVLTKPLEAAAVAEVVAKLGLVAAPEQDKSRSEARKRLLEAVDQSKKLRQKQETLIRHIDLLRAELKDKKMPFKRKGHTYDQEPPAATAQSA